MAESPLLVSVSGLRGIVGVSFTPEIAALYASAFAGWLRDSGGAARPRICLARDGRRSGEGFALAAGGALLASGCDVVDLGVAATPTVGVAISHHRADGAMVITASHNPQEWNGIKALDGEGLAPPPERAATLAARFQARRSAWAGPIGAGTLITDPNATARHVQRVLSQVDSKAIAAKRFHVVLDSVNASGCIGGRMLLEALGCALTHLHGEQSGIFAHAPEPVEANLGGLMAATARAEGAACGFAQDPDADRLAIVDEKGRYIGEECTLALATLRMLERTGGGTIAANLSTSRMVDDIAAKFRSSRVIRTAVGEANVVAALKKEGGIIGGEGNGGVILPGVCWIRDSLSAMALVLELLAARGTPLSEIVAELPRYEMVKEKLDLGAVGGAAAVRPALAAARAAFAKGRIDDRDGVRIDLADGWVHLRASNTEPIVRIIAEAATRERAKELVAECRRAAGFQPAGG